MKILFTGDWHLDRNTAGYDRYDDISSKIDETVAKATELDIDLYVFLGDLANPNSVRSHRAVTKAIEVARKLSLQKRPIQSMWIVGNHDIIEDGLGFGVLSPIAAAGFSVFSYPVVIEEFKIPIVVLPYPSTTHFYEPAEFVARYSTRAVYNSDSVLVVGHLSMQGAAMGSESTELSRGREHAWPIEAIRKRWPSAIMIGGHYHKQQVFNDVSFAGSLERLGFDEEENSPGFLTLEI
jgi:DNA repair exonuclease SbcCD nuclease subunit